jgi:Asp-tRNA(Asn)/Glu-tRNA(Gln) amidotransferase A subunit family amidase
MSIHSANFIWGLASNFYDRSRTCGGSSGGDAGLVGSRCVPFAIGSDVGGSIRIPSSFLGLTGFKPSHLRVSHRGAVTACHDHFFPNGDLLKPVSGPIAHSARDCYEIFKLQVHSQQHLSDPF